MPILSLIGSYIRRIIFFLTLILLSVFSAGAQIISDSNSESINFADSVKKEYNLGPIYSMYKVNYFTLGTSIGHIPDAHNSDVKFQISFQIRLTNATLPWNTYLYLFYSQKTFWNIFENSLPMRDMNFNPGIGWTKPFFSKGRYIGKASLIVEHESNGKDGPTSRSWNRVTFSGQAMVTPWLMVHAKTWIPIIDGMNNKDILKYYGIFQTGFQLNTIDKKIGIGFTFLKRQGWNLNCNTIIDAFWRVNKKTNLTLFAQYYNGYGENLIDYNKFHSRLRAGIAFYPPLYPEY